MDFEPREGMEIICQSLKNLAEMVAKEVQAEEQVNSGEALLNRAIDTYWDACLYIDTNVSDRWKIKYCNDAFIQLTGEGSLPCTQGLCDDLRGSQCNGGDW